MWLKNSGYWCGQSVLPMSTTTLMSLFLRKGGMEGEEGGRETRCCIRKCRSSAFSGGSREVHMCVTKFYERVRSDTRTNQIA